MAIFDSKKTTYLTYYIVLTDPTEVERLNGLYPEGQNLAPWAPDPHQGSVAAGGDGGAAVVYSAPWRGYTEAAAGANPPYTWSDWAGTDDDDKPFPLNLKTFERHTGGFFGIGGTTIRYYWMGKFVYEAPHQPGAGGGPAVVANTPKRRFIQGFELVGTAPQGVSLHRYSADASRHPGGRGLAIRGLTNSADRIAVDQYDSSYTGTVSKTWERFYVRLRKKPTAATVFWRTHGYQTSDGIGQALAVTPSGALAIYTSGASNVYTFVDTVPDVTLEEWSGHADEDAWHRIDVVLECVNPGTFRVFVDGELKTDGPGAIGGAPSGGSASRHTASSVGAPNVLTSDLYLDLDDWVCADWPTTFDGQDWLGGSKIVRLLPASLTGASSGSYTGVGGFRALAQPVDVSFAPLSLSSSTSGALLEVNTNADRAIGADTGSAGVASLLIGGVVQKAGGADPQMGASLAGAAPTMATVPITTSQQGKATILSTQAGATAPIPPVHPVVLRLTKGADAQALSVFSFGAAVEMVGRWTTCDYLPEERADLGTAIVLPTSMGAHNFPYPRSPWSTRGAAPPISPYTVIGGLYTGNGTGQDLTFPSPVHFLWIRPATANAGGFLWMAPAAGSHKFQQRQVDANLVYAEEDPTFAAGAGEDAQQQAYRIRIAGSDNQVNANAVSYQYIAICDPGMRFLVTGTALEKNGIGDHVNPLVLGEGYTPEWAFVQLETLTSNTTKSFYGKGPGNAPATIASLAGGALANALTFSAGNITIGAGLNGQDAAYTYGLYRKSDDSGDTGLPAVVAFGSYVGDGSGSRSVNLAPASGKRPLFCLIFPETGAGYWRDPTHTGSNSSTNVGTETTTGITSGTIDGFSVGSSLNANGVVYSWFLLFAGATACNNGWGCNGVYNPVEPVAADGGSGGWPATPGEPVPEAPGTPDTPGSGFPGQPGVPVDFSAECYTWAQYMVNVALSRIGVSKQIIDIRTDASQEAYKGRLVYALDVEAVLRAYAWPFATRYVDLVLLAGTDAAAVNRDWQYSYRAPASMVTARRIVGQAGQKRGYDPDPVQFKIGTDDTGYLIFTDAVSTTGAPVQLEYTARMSCPASQGDALFRDALCWKLAASLARSLAKDEKKARECEVLFRDVIDRAETTAANEQQSDTLGGDAPWIAGR